MSEKKKTSFFDKLLTQNPVFGLYLGICSTLAITTNINNALGMGVAVTVVLVLSNILVSCVRNITPDDIHIPVYIVIIATLVTVVEMFMQAYTTDLYAALGVFIDGCFLYMFSVCDVLDQTDSRYWCIDTVQPIYQCDNLLFADIACRI